LFFILIVIFCAVVGSFIPIGNENSTVRRLPVVTFGIMATCVLIFFITLPAEADNFKAYVTAEADAESFLSQNEGLKADDGLRARMVQVGLISQSEADDIKEQLKNDRAQAEEYNVWLQTSEAAALREQMNTKLTALSNAQKERIMYRFGFAPNGDWQF